MKFPEPGSCKDKLFRYLRSGQPYTHAMSQQFGISGTASPKRLQELQQIHGLQLEWIEKKSSNGKPYREYRMKKEEPKTFTQQNLFNEQAA